MIAVVDYGVGNLFSVCRSLDALGLACQVTRDPEIIARADRLILPGVGAFRDAIGKLTDTGLIPLLKARASQGTPLLGICLGMQLLFEKSYEYGEYEGLSLLPGEIRPIRDDLQTPLKVPQIGWNALTIRRASPLTKYLASGECVYYVHSYYAKGAGDAVVASSEYGVDIPGIVQRGNVAGCQFHPEKSGKTGLNILKAFSEMEAGAC